MEKEIEIFLEEELLKIDLGSIVSCGLASKILDKNGEVEIVELIGFSSPPFDFKLYRVVKLPKY